MARDDVEWGRGESSYVADGAVSVDHRRVGNVMNVVNGASGAGRSGGRDGGACKKGSREARCLDGDGGQGRIKYKADVVGWVDQERGGNMTNVTKGGCVGWLCCGSW